MTDSTAIRENLKASKSIGELNRFVSESPTAIRDHAIPTQLGTENYRILVSEIIAAIVKGDIGLGNVDNTSDANKPLSNASRAALQRRLTLTTRTRLQVWKVSVIYWLSSLPRTTRFLYRTFKLLLKRSLVKPIQLTRTVLLTLWV